MPSEGLKELKSRRLAIRRRLKEIGTERTQLKEEIQKINEQMKASSGASKDDDEDDD